MAFSVGIGLTLGKWVGEMANSALNGVVLGVAQLAAKNGNEIVQNALDRAGVEYEKKEEKTEDNIIGFHS